MDALHDMTTTEPPAANLLVAPANAFFTPTDIPTDIPTKIARSRATTQDAADRRMADLSPLMIWLTGDDGLATYLNQPLLSFFGVTAPDMLGSGWSNFVCAADSQFALERYLTAFYARQPFSMEFRMRRMPSQTEVWVQSVGMPRYAPDGEFSGFVGFIFDISHRRLLAD